MAGLKFVQNCKVLGGQMSKEGDVDFCTVSKDGSAIKIGSSQKGLSLVIQDGGMERRLDVPFIITEGITTPKALTRKFLLDYLKDGSWHKAVVPASDVAAAVERLKAEKQPEATFEPGVKQIG